MVTAIMPSGGMRSEDECLAMAAAMERRAGSCGSPRHSAEFRSIAERWRGLASRAAWQDAGVG